MATDADTTDLVRQRLHRIQGPPEAQLGNRVVQEGIRQLSLPGAYTRGLLAGKPGEKATSEEMLGRPLGPVGTFAWDVATDPLTYAGPGLMKAGGKAADLLRAGGAALGEGPAASPLVNALHRFGREESGKLDWNVFGRGLRTPARRALAEMGPEDYFRSRGLPYEDLPATRIETLGEKLGIPVEWARPGEEGGLATYRPWSGSVALPPVKRWVAPELMRSEMGEMGTGVPPWLSTTDPRHLGVHELVHGLHHRVVGSELEHVRGQSGVIDPETLGWLRRNVSELAGKNPNEAVAEVGSKMALTPGAIVKPPVRAYYQERGGPDLRELRHALGLD